MNCPNDQNDQMQKVLFHHVEVDCCPVCMGIWFDADELRYAKDDKDAQLNWLDFDIWRDKSKFKMTNIDKRCPTCRLSFVQVAYDHANVKIDFCKHCQGIWLDRGEFKQIIMYLKKKADYEILHHYTKNLVKELWEVFAGPERLREELADFLTLVKLFNYKFMVQHPLLTKMMDEMPK